MKTKSPILPIGMDKLGYIFIILTVIGALYILQYENWYPILRKCESREISWCGELARTGEFPFGGDWDSYKAGYGKCDIEAPTEERCCAILGLECPIIGNPAFCNEKEKDYCEHMLRGETELDWEDFVPEWCKDHGFEKPEKPIEEYCNEILGVPTFTVS